jgi:hypothetical protein
VFEETLLCVSCVVLLTLPDLTTSPQDVL